MSLADIIKPDSVLCNAHARSKKHSLEILSELLVRSLPEIASDDIFGRLISRERLGCTGMSQGVAFPHCRIEGIDDSRAALIKLSEPVDFDSADGIPVDLVFGLLVPENLDESDYADIHQITSLLTDADLLRQLRTAKTSKELHRLLLAAAAGGPQGQLRAAEGG